MTIKLFLQESLTKNPHVPLNIKAGTVRTYVILMFLCVILVYFLNPLGNNDIILPLHFLVILGIILAFYKFTSKNIVPENFLAVSGAANVTQNEFILQTYRKIRLQISLIIKKTSNLQEALKDGSVDTKTMKTQLNELSSLGKVSFRVETVLEKMAIALLLICVFYLNLIVLSQGPSAVTNLLFTPTIMTLFGIVSGSLISEFIIYATKNPLEKTFTNFSRCIKEINDHIDWDAPPTSDAFKSIPDSLKTCLYNFKKKNHIQFLSYDVLAIIAIIGVFWATTMILVNPVITIASPPLIGLEIIVAFHFGSK